MEEVIEEYVMSFDDSRGVVVNCAYCPVYDRPVADPFREIVKLAMLSDVLINRDESTEDFYKVCTETSVEGYCEKKYIAVPLM